MALKHKIMGKKRGMTHLFDDKGHLVPCTVIEVQPNKVVQIKTTATDGYEAIQVGFDTITAKDERRRIARTNKPQRKHFENAGVQPTRHLQESRLESTEGYSLGQEITVGMLKDVAYVDATATSIGKGFQGGMKLHNFKGLPNSHGSNKVHRQQGSTGNRTSPGRCFPGGKRPSHMGHRRVTVQNLRVVQIDEQENLVIIEGAIPGPNNGLVTLTAAKKKSK